MKWKSNTYEDEVNKVKGKTHTFYIKFLDL